MLQNVSFKSMTQAQAKVESCNSLVIDEGQWKMQRRRHVQRLAPIVNAHRKRVLKGEKHPVIDFLFEYYHFKPSKLLDWSPGVGLILSGDQASDYLAKKQFCKSKFGVFVNPALFPENRLIGLEWVINLLESTQQRKPVFGCFGLHEWCMIYEKSDVRHTEIPLRISHSQIRKIVEQNQINCTHYDAFRFYSNSARKFNRLTLSRAEMLSHEQPGCLHSNMDLYRWAYKFHPWLASELIAETFLLAMEIRITDMRASPYDVSDYTSMPAIKIETRQGKEEYAGLQRNHYHKASALRLNLIKELGILKTHILNHVSRHVYNEKG